MSTDSILSQNAIDALLAGIPKESPAERVTPAPRKDASPAPANTAAPKPAESIDQPIVTFDDVIEIAGKAAEAEAAPVQDSISRIYQRIGQLEEQVARIPQLEAEIDRLKRAA